VEEALSHVANGALHFALGLRPVGSAGSGREPPVSAEAEELGVLDETSAFHSQVSRDHGAHLVEEQLARYAPETLECLLQALEEGAHILAGKEAEPQQPRVAEHDHEGVSHAPGELKAGEVYLCLAARIGLEAHNGLGGRTRP